MTLWFHVHESTVITFVGTYTAQWLCQNTAIIPDENKLAYTVIAGMLISAKHACSYKSTTHLTEQSKAEYIICMSIPSQIQYSYAVPGCH